MMTSTLEDIELPDMDDASIGEASPIETVPTPVAATSSALKTSPAPNAPRRPSVVTSAVPLTSSRSSGKSKKKKGQAQVSMASAPSSGGGSLGNQGENTGRWTAEEHRLFLQGLEQHGKGWKKIASLIKSRTVVQIRTHAQKYFQKLAKARQNGEDEGAVTFMEGRGGAASVTSASTIIVAPRRRRQVTGTKRKAIQSVVASAQRQGKKLAAAQAASGVPNPMAPLPAVAPALAYFVLPTSSTAPATAATNGIPAPGTIPGPALEDSL
jgi:SHAQKYF class myb-like DNA-binding protein